MHYWAEQDIQPLLELACLSPVFLYLLALYSIRINRINNKSCAVSCTLAITAAFICAIGILLLTSLRQSISIDYKYTHLSVKSTPPTSCSAPFRQHFNTFTEAFTSSPLHFSLSDISAGIASYKSRLDTYRYWRAFYRRYIKLNPYHQRYPTIYRAAFAIGDASPAPHSATLSLRFNKTIREEFDLTPDGFFSIACKPAFSSSTPIRPFYARITDINLKEHMTFPIPPACLNNGSPVINVDYSSSTDRDRAIYTATTASNSLKTISLRAESTSAYTQKQAYFAGEDIDLRISSSSSVVSFSIFKHGNPPSLIKAGEIGQISARPYDYSELSADLNWPVSIYIKTDPSWTSGYYYAKITSGSSDFYVYFLISEKPTNSNIAFLAPTLTWHAYNSWGGESLYRSDIGKCTGETIRNTITLQRPLSLGSPDANGIQRGTHLVHADMMLISWLDKIGVKYNVIDDRVLHSNPSALANVKTLILSAHPEYWTDEMRQSVSSHLSKGGNLIYLGGNGIYQRVSLLGSAMEGYNDIQHHVQDRKPGGFYYLLGRPQSEMLGVQYDSRDYNTFSPYKVLAHDHWIFDGTNLKPGDSFGAGIINNVVTGAAGHEMDKVTSFSPANLVKLAVGSSTNGAHMTIYQHPAGGLVFSAGSISFATTLSQDAAQSRILQNLFDRIQDQNSHINASSAPSQFSGPRPPL